MLARPHVYAKRMNWSTGEQENYFETIVITITLFLEDNIDGTSASLTYGPQLLVQSKLFMTESIYSM